MGLAIDTVGFFATNPGATITAATVSPGDSFTIRSFAPSSSAFLEEIVRKGATAGMVRVRSPLVHDNVRGVMFSTGETPSRFLLPPEVGQVVQSQDNLIVEVSGGTAETDTGVLIVYYSDLLGASARLRSWGDIAHNIKNIKPVEVDLTTSGTIGTWVDTVLTTTENLMHANSDYAVLGYVLDVACLAFGVKGQDTSNLRVCGPGITDSSDTSDFFVKQSDRHGTPHIPVISAANRFSTYVSALSDTASVAIKGQLVLAELVNPAGA